MSTTTDDLFARVLELPADDRAKLACLLIHSLEVVEADPDRDAAWAAEIESRLQAIEEGRATLIPWEDVKARLRGSIRQGPER